MFFDDATVSTTPCNGLPPLTRDEARALLNASGVPIETDVIASRLGLTDAHQPNYFHGDLLDGIAEKAGHVKVWGRRADGSGKCKGSRRLQAVWALIYGRMRGERIHAEMRNVTGVLGGYLHSYVIDDETESTSERTTCCMSASFPAKLVPVGDNVRYDVTGECVSVYVPRESVAQALTVLDGLSAEAVIMEKKFIARYATEYGATSRGLYMLSREVKWIAKKVERWEKTK